MDIFQIFILTLYTTQVFTKKSKYRKHQQSSEDGSIENLLYYKDCQRKGKEVSSFPLPTHKPMLLRYEPPPTQPPNQPDCPFPKMCCSLTCGNECGNQPFVNRQTNPIQNILPVQPIQPIGMEQTLGMRTVQSQLLQRRKKKLRSQQNKILPSMLGTRRDFSGFTKEKIKSLISQDDDIRKILKDLVRVTMKKVDLLDMINSGKSRDNIIQKKSSDVVITEPAPIPEIRYDEYDE